MMNTNRHNFYLPEPTDDVVLSIQRYGENFQKIDKLIEKQHPNLNAGLIVGELYNSGQKIYNNTPAIGDYVGWVNIKTGRYANAWLPDKAYNVGDIVVPNVNNGYYYRCVTQGVSSPLEPTFLTNIGDNVDDTYGILSWTPSTLYTKDKIVKRTSGSTTYYYKCITTGTSDTTEPNWVNVNGTTQVDGSVTWMVMKKAVWVNEGTACEFRPFGKID